MLLLLVNSYRYALSDIFDVRQGSGIPYIKEERKSKNAKKYKLLYPADLNQVFKSLDGLPLSDYQVEREINPEKILTAEDYILTCKGIIRGFSMQHSKVAISAAKENGSTGMLPSNHFIVLRAREISKEMYGIPYMHNLLDLLVPKLNEFTEQRAGKKLLRYITISDIVNITLDLPLKNWSNKEKDFDAVYKPWKKNLDQFSKTELILKDYNNKLMEEINIQWRDLQKK
jgi:hypothetical protein